MSRCRSSSRRRSAGNRPRKTNNNGSIWLAGDLVERGQVVGAAAGEDVVPGERKIARHRTLHVALPHDLPVIALGGVNILVEAREIDAGPVNHRSRGDEVGRAIAADGFAGFGIEAIDAAVAAAGIDRIPGDDRRRGIMVPARIGIVDLEPLRLGLAERRGPQPPAGREVELEQRLVGRDVRATRPRPAASREWPRRHRSTRRRRRRSRSRPSRPRSRWRRSAGCAQRRTRGRRRRPNAGSASTAALADAASGAARRLRRLARAEEPRLELVNRDQCLRDHAGQRLALALEASSRCCQARPRRGRTVTLLSGLSSTPIVGLLKPAMSFPSRSVNVQPDVLLLADMAERRSPPAGELGHRPRWARTEDARLECDQCRQAALHAYPRPLLGPALAVRACRQPLIGERARADCELPGRAVHR